MKKLRKNKFHTLALWSSLQGVITDLLFKWFINLLNVFDSTNYILKIFKKAFIMGTLRLWLHQWNLLNFTLKKLETLAYIPQAKKLKPTTYLQPAYKILKYLNLKNQKAVVIQINTFPSQQLGDLCEVTGSIIYIIFRRIIPKCNPCYHKITSWYSFISSIIL